MYKFIKEYFDLKFYTSDDVKIFVRAKWISEEEYKTITTVNYTE